MEIIKDTVKNVMQAWEGKEKVSRKDNPEVLLKKVLSKKEWGHIKLSYFSKGILSINVDSSTWLYHLGLQKEDLLAKLRKKSEAIQDIRFRLGEIR